MKSLHKKTQSEANTGFGHRSRSSRGFIVASEKTRLLPPSYVRPGCGAPLIAPTSHEGLELLLAHLLTLIGAEAVEAGIDAEHRVDVLTPCRERYGICRLGGGVAARHLDDLLELAPRMDEARHVGDTGVAKVVVGRVAVGSEVARPSREEFARDPALPGGMVLCLVLKPSRMLSDTEIGALQIVRLDAP